MSSFRYTKENAALSKDVDDIVRSLKKSVKLEALCRSLAPFLRDGVAVQGNDFSGGWQDIVLTLDDQILTITASGDHGARFYSMNGARDE